jgi:starch synthase
VRILSVASEVFPLIKTGGLADVAGALPGAIKPHNCDVTTFLPGYRQVKAKLIELGATDERLVHDFGALFGSPARLVAYTLDDMALVILDCPGLFDREGGPYGDATGKDWVDNWTRFAAFSAAAAAYGCGRAGSAAFDVIHAHDWQAGLVPFDVAHGRGPRPATLMTIHNIAFQGQFSPSIFPALGLPQAAMSVEGIEYYGDVGFLKAGLQYATAITTVSPTYAEEITTPEFGMGLDGLIRARGADVHGIVNGIDTGVWNPGTDAHLVSHYSATTMERRSANKSALQARFGLAPTSGPLFAVVSRLTWQKGMDLLSADADLIVSLGGSLAVLGAGDVAIEAELQAAAARHPGKIGVIIGYNEGLSHLMQAGADALLVPSRFEPCGLTQLCALRYGAIPVVARTGGLADTVVDLNHAAQTAKSATGVQFYPITRDQFGRALRRTIDAYHDGPQWLSLQKRGMAADVSWDNSAALYAKLYRDIAAREAGRISA